jgi:hypothetical protein
MVTTTSQKDKALCKAPVWRSSDRRQRSLTVIGAVLAAATVVTSFHAMQDPILMRMLMLTGHLWLDELLEGHPTQFQEQMGMAHHVLHQLSNELQTLCGLSDSKYVTTDEQCFSQGKKMYIHPVILTLCGSLLTSLQYCLLQSISSSRPGLRLPPILCLKIKKLLLLEGVHKDGIIS